MPVAWNIYLAARRIKADQAAALHRSMRIYLRDIVGQRAPFYGDARNPFLFVYFVISPGTESDEAWINEEDGDNRIYWLFRCWRCSRQVIASGGGREISGIRFMDGFINPFHDQGVTSNVL